MTVRPVRNRDAAGLIDLIDRCFSEYPGVVVEPDGIDSDLRAYATALEKIGGEGFVVEQEGRIVGLVSGCLARGDLYQLKRIYLDAKLRGSGMGEKLLRLIEGRAKACGAESIELWSDSRFLRAHRFYQREGYVKQAVTRDLHDCSNTTENYFIKKL